MMIVMVSRILFSSKYFQRFQRTFLLSLIIIIEESRLPLNLVMLTGTASILLHQANQDKQCQQALHWNHISFLS